MNSVILYLLQSAAVLILFYCFYYFILKNETRYQLNRIYLLASGAFSFIIPLVKFEGPVTLYDSKLTAPIFQLNGTVKPSGPNFSDYLLWIYSAVCLLLLIKSAYDISVIMLMIKRSNKVYINKRKCILLKSGASPFSFFNYIFLPEDKINNPEIDSLISHEEVHISNYHSFDIIFYQIISIVQWFNPFVRFCKRELEAQHEFYADFHLVSKIIDAVEYKTLLFNYNLLTGGGSYTNNFNSLLKRRFEMLDNISFKKSGIIKFALVIPFVVLVVVFANAANINHISAPGTKDTLTSGKVYTFVDHMPQFAEGGDKGLLNFLANNIKYPAQAKDGNVQGRVIISFIVTSTGEVKDFVVLKGIGSGCDEEAIRVLKNMPPWIPGMLQGEKVNVRVSLPVNFVLK